MVLSIPGNVPSQPQIVLIHFAILVLLLDSVRPVDEYLHQREHLPGRHEDEQNVDQVRAKLYSFHIEIAHEIHEHEVELSLAELCEVVVVERLLRQTQLVCEVKELHAKRLLRLLIIDVALGWFQAKVVEDDGSLVQVEDSRSEGVLRLVMLFQFGKLLPMDLCYCYLSGHVSIQVVERLRQGLNVDAGPNICDIGPLWAI